MSTFAHYDHLVRKAINQEMLRKAQQHRTAHQAQTRNNRFYCCALNWLGGRMIAWGQQLRDRYKSSFQTPVPQANEFAVN